MGLGLTREDSLVTKALQLRWVGLLTIPRCTFPRGSVPRPHVFSAVAGRRVAETCGAELSSAETCSAGSWPNPGTAGCFSSL